MNLVTGAAGYIGSHFVKNYLNIFPEDEIIVVDDLSEGYEQAIGYSDRIHFVRENIGNVKIMTELFTQYKIQTVIHFAASTYVGESQQNPSKYFYNNCIQTLNMFKAMELAEVKEIVFSSTCATYGSPNYLPLDEDHPQKPINVYGTTKLMTEQALEAYSKAKGWSFVSLRYFNACGADESGIIGEMHAPETHLIPLALKSALGKRGAIQIYGSDYDTPDGTCIRDYIHVNDLADAHIKAISYLRRHKGGEAFNLGTTTGSSVLEVIKMCEEVTGYTIPIQYIGRRQGDPAILVANSDKAQKLLSWKTKYDLRKTIETAWAWERQPAFQ